MNEPAGPAARAKASRRFAPAQLATMSGDYASVEELTAFLCALEGKKGVLTVLAQVAARGTEGAAHALLPALSWKRDDAAAIALALMGDRARAVLTAAPRSPRVERVLSLLPSPSPLDGLRVGLSTNMVAHAAVPRVLGRGAAVEVPETDVYARVSADAGVVRVTADDRVLAVFGADGSWQVGKATGKDDVPAGTPFSLRIEVGAGRVRYVRDAASRAERSLAFRFANIDRWRGPIRVELVGAGEGEVVVEEWAPHELAADTLALFDCDGATKHSDRARARALASLASAGGPRATHALRVAAVFLDGKLGAAACAALDGTPEPRPSPAPASELDAIRARAATAGLARVSVDPETWAKPRSRSLPVLVIAKQTLSPGLELAQALLDLLGSRMPGLPVHAAGAVHDGVADIELELDYEEHVRLLARALGEDVALYAGKGTGVIDEAEELLGCVSPPSGAPGFAARFE